MSVAFRTEIHAPGSPADVILSAAERIMVGSQSSSKTFLNAYNNGISTRYDTRKATAMAVATTTVRTAQSLPL